jgi:hypothetical protein
MVVPRLTEILKSYPASRFGNMETRGLDSWFATDTYVETGLDRLLPPAILAGELGLIILCGNAGDGKTALLQNLAVKLGMPAPKSEIRVHDASVGALNIKINLDGAASWNGRTADELLDEVFEPFQHGRPAGCVHLVAVNDGRLLEWIGSYENRHGETHLTRQLAEALGPGERGLDPHIRFIELNQRSLVGGIKDGAHHVSTEFVDELIEKLVGGTNAPDIWQACNECTAQSRCSMRVSAEMMGASREPAVSARGTLLRQRLTEAFQAVHQRNEVHITARELKAALSYILFGVHSCEDLHKDMSMGRHEPADYCFDSGSPLRQGDLLRELTRLDPALNAHPRVDRYLVSRGAPDPAHGAQRFHQAPLGNARRRAYFAWSDDQIEQVGGSRSAVGLHGGHHLADFREFPLLPPERQQEIRDELCRGLSRLEALPEVAFRTSGYIPVRIVPRTPTESSFWVAKPQDRFTLVAERFPDTPGLETLHRYLVLSYRLLDDRTDGLIVPLELFTLLREVAEGVQILDAFSDDVFANLAIFTQRLAQEDESSVHAWNPANEESAVAVKIDRMAAGQIIRLSGLSKAET